MDERSALCKLYVSLVVETTPVEGNQVVIRGSNAAGARQVLAF